MRTIDLDRWPRKAHFEKFRDCHVPHFTMCADVDLTALRRAAKQRVVPITAAIVYVVTRAANDIPEFRQRIRGETVVEHDVVHPSATVLVANDLFSFCPFTYTSDFMQFADHVAARITEVTERPSLEELPGRDDLLFMSAIPWVSFTSFAHPILSVPMDSIPRFAWGRFSEEEGVVTMPLSVQGHHALVDGLHMGRYYEAVQGYLHHPERFMGDPLAQSSGALAP